MAQKIVCDICGEPCELGYRKPVLAYNVGDMRITIREYRIDAKQEDRCWDCTRKILLEAFGPKVCIEDPKDGQLRYLDTGKIVMG